MPLGYLMAVFDGDHFHTEIKKCDAAEVMEE